MRLRPIPATNAGPELERIQRNEMNNADLRQTFYGFSALMSTWWSLEQEQMIEFSVQAVMDEEERGL